MGICDLYNSSLNSEMQFEEIKDFVNEMMESWGFDPPNWADIPTPEMIEDGIAAGYDVQSDTIHLDTENFSDVYEGGVPILLLGALHESLHATIDQLGWDMDIGEEEFLSSLETNDLINDLNEACENPAESGAPSNLPSMPWVSE